MTSEEDSLRRSKGFWLSRQSGPVKKAIKEDETFRKIVGMFWSPDMVIRYRKATRSTTQPTTRNTPQE